MERKLFWTIKTDSKGRDVAVTMGMKNQEGTGALSIYNCYKGNDMNYTRRKERARKRRAAIMVEALGWMAVSIGVSLVGLVWYTFAVVVLGNG